MEKEVQTDLDLETKDLGMEDRIQDYLQRNPVRKMFQGDSEERFQIFKGFVYQTLHTLLIMGCVYAVLFIDNVVSLTCIMFIVLMDGMSNVVFHNCPLTMLEEKYLGEEFSGNKMYKNMIQSFIGKNYKTDHTFESQLEVIITGWCLLAIKILFIVIFRSSSST